MPLAVQEPQMMWVWSLGKEDHLEKEMATHSSILALEIPWTEKPGRLASIGLQRIGHDWSDLAGMQSEETWHLQETMQLESGA